MKYAIKLKYLQLKNSRYFSLEFFIINLNIKERIDITELYTFKYLYEY